MIPELVVEARHVSLLVSGILEPPENLVVNLKLLPLLPALRRGSRFSAPAALIVLHRHHLRERPNSRGRREKKQKQMPREQGFRAVERRRAYKCGCRARFRRRKMKNPPAKKRSESDICRLSLSLSLYRLSCLSLNGYSLSFSACPEESIHPAHPSSREDSAGPTCLVPGVHGGPGPAYVIFLRSGNAVGAMRTPENEADVEPT